jgi:hypothetical protein
VCVCVCVCVCARAHAPESSLIDLDMNIYLDALVCCIIYLYDSYLGWKKGSKNRATSPLSLSLFT